MRVVTVNATQNTGGAARAAYRLHRALRGAGVDSQMVVREGGVGDSSILGPPTRFSRVLARLRPQLETAALQLRRRPFDNFTASIIPDRAVRRINDLAPTVAHLHWLGPGFLHIESLARIRAPIVWTLHDLWALTGGCHYPGDCCRYEERCGACPALGSRQGADLSRLGWHRKRRAWSALNITLVSPSRWLAESARKSSLFGERRIEVIPNGLDTEVFRPIRKETAREILNLPQDKTLVLFSAMGGAANPIKGFDLLAMALGALAGSGRARNLELMVVGASSVPGAAGIGVPVHCLGQLYDDISITLANAAADALVAPSRQENLANTVMEALACGTPAVAFDVGGMPDLIEPGVNGVLVPPFDTRALAEAIAWVLDDPERRRRLGLAARAKVEREYSLGVLAQRYMTLYGKVVRTVNRSPDG